MSELDAIGTGKRSSGNGPRVLVIGGGLAGMASALALESAGLRVTLVEASRRLGGRAGSFRDPQSGQEVDFGQHVLLGCCTNLRDFYRRIGTASQIRYQRKIYFRDIDGRRWDLWACPGLPAPLHLGASLLWFGGLPVWARLSLIRHLQAMMVMGRRRHQVPDGMTFSQWLGERQAGRQLIERFYRPVVLGALNEEPEQVSAAYAIRMCQEAFLKHRNGWVLGFAACPLGALYDGLPFSDVRLGSRASQILVQGGRVVGLRMENGEILRAEAYVLATDYHACGRLLDESARAADGRFAELGRLQSVPILAVRLWFDRPVLSETHAALLSGPLQWVFRKDREGCQLQGVISAARSWVGRQKGQCLAAFEQQIRHMLPAARSARLVRGLMLIDRRATFSPVPGVDRLRPSQQPGPGGIENLFLAGDYTRTGWPATMEGAVRSGYLAAEGVARLLGAGQAQSRFIVDD